MPNTLLLLASIAAFQQPAVIAFTDVNVVPMDREATIAGQTVLVRDGRIAAVGPSNRVRVPAGATRIDGRGKFLMPGLTEMHAHIPGPNNAELQQRVLFMYLAGGVTTIRGMLGAPQHLELRDQAARGTIWSPTIITSGPSLNGNTAPNPDAARRMVEEQKQAGYDFLKIHPGLSRAVFDTMAATAQRVGIRFSGHVPADVGVERALEARYATIDHVDGYPEWLAGNSRLAPGFFGLGVLQAVDASRMPEIVRRTREAGVWIVPTQTLMETMAGGESVEAMTNYPGSQYLPPQMIQGWANSVNTFRQQNTDAGVLQRYLELRRRMIRELHAGGVGILLGSDAPQWMNPPGFSAHRELGSYVRSGLTAYQALQTGTVNVARFFGTPDEFGTVAAGRRADLVLLDANPLENIGNVSRIAGVMVRGRWLSRTDIDQRLTGR